MTVAEYTDALIKEFRDRLRGWDVDKFADGIKGTLNEEEFINSMSWILKHLTKTENMIFDLGVAELECRRLLSTSRDKNNMDAVKTLNEALITFKDIKGIVLTRQNYLETVATLLRSIRANKPRV